MERYYEKRRSRSPPSSKHSNSSVNRIDLPQYIPLSNSSKDTFKYSRDRDHNSPSRSSPSRKKLRKQIVYDDNNSQSSMSSRSRLRSRSPIHNIPSDHRRKNSLERSNRSVFSRLGSDPQFPRYSASPSLWHNPNSKDFNGSSLEPDQMRIVVVRNDNFQGRSSFSAATPQQHQDVSHNGEAKESEIIYAIKCLEQQNRDNMRHINGIRLTVENYHREIAKLESIVLASSREIENLKSLLNFPNSH